MKIKDKLKHILDRYECSYHQTKKRGLIPHYKDYWTVFIPKKTKTFLRITLASGYSNPFSIILEGREINPRLYGKRDDYSPYIKSNYPYLQIESMFCLHRGTLTDAFIKGLDSDYSKNPWDAASHNGEVTKSYFLSFEVGRYVLHKFYHVDLPRKMLFGPEGLLS